MQKKWQIVGLIFFILFLAPFSISYAQDNRVNREILASGSYFDYKTQNQKPLLVEAKRFDMWNIPQEIYQNVPENMSYGTFRSTSCANNFCVAVGENFYQGLPKPLLATLDSSSKWSYLSSVLPQYTEAGLYNVNCGASLCIAVGSGEMKNSRVIPVLITSADGKSWVSPESITANLPRNVEEAEFTGSTCDDNGCIAIGVYTPDRERTNYLPLVAVSPDKGQTWNYSMNFKMNKPNVTEIILEKVRCNNDTCLIGGLYYQANDKAYLPFLAVSHDKGQNWFFPESILTNMPGGMHPADIRDIVSHKNTWFAVGYFQDKKYPLFAMSKDKGVTWTYPDALVKSSANGGFDAISCYRDMCLAAGNRSLFDKKISQPLFAFSKDNGENWTYDDFWLPQNIEVSGAACNHDACFVSTFPRANSLNTLIFYTKNDSSTKLAWQNANFALPPGYESGSLTNINNTLD